jgi:uncharacterized protein (TIGR02268 family)
MRNPLSMRPVLLLLLVASAALARDRDKVAVRTLLRSEHPGQWTPTLHVTGQVSCVLRFDQPVDPARTRMLGWEGRFEPLLAGGNKVVVEPLHDLDIDERVPLIVTLADGTEVAFLLAPPSLEESFTDQQVNVFKDRESYNAVLSFLYDALGRERVLKEENKRLREEETSEDHALAALLASGAVTQTPFVVANRFFGKDDDTKVDTAVFKGKSKAAVVFKIKNLDPAQHWSLKSAHLVTKKSGRERVVAVRSSVPSISPGASGVVALVVDRSAFVDDGELTSLFLEIYRHDGLRQAIVQLDPHLVAR